MARNKVANSSVARKSNGHVDSAGNGEGEQELRSSPPPPRPATGATCDFCDAPLPTDKAKRRGHYLTHVRQAGQELRGEDGEGAPDVLDLASTSAKRAQAMANVVRELQLSQRLGGLLTATPQDDARVLALQQQLDVLKGELVKRDLAAQQAETKAMVQSEFTKMREEFASKIAPAAVTSKENGGHSLEAVLVEKLLDKIITPAPDPIAVGKAYLDGIKEYGTIVQQPNDNATKNLELQMRWNMWRAQEDERRAIELARIEAQTQADEKQRGTIESLGKLAITAMQGPMDMIARNVGDGAKMWMARGASPGAGEAAPPVAPPARPATIGPPESLSREERQALIQRLRTGVPDGAAYLRRLEELEAEDQARAQAAAQQPAQPQEGTP